jgi:hypothetical protein
MTWLKPKAAAVAWCGGVSVKLLYRAMRRGELKAAPIGAGRNFLLCEEWCDAWLRASAEKKPKTVKFPAA